MYLHVFMYVCMYVCVLCVVCACVRNVCVVCRMYCAIDAGAVTHLKQNHATKAYN